ncbi:VOC family protein [Kaistia dalseonensis]|uniref:Catechol 2,3-dioxygenase-like lactoylglutathione lyase family enzyme n=1 Tax=Kaistia dalseonensis TaxID=410840 RepID=A0ABU0H597_9HYPH|nr:VOC family protein [Kaistia dalseonensis]MCX5494348.1 VOC family protein [Kaistia dalseonensis]MDQ0436930.1 catechol 2,3-dioxygenase-like lactoylglutathione lyase family enzyme [Kaistia dalseonensis]
MAGLLSGADIRWHHASLTVSAIDPAVRFFGDVFGFEIDFLERGMADDIAKLTGKPGLVCDFVQMRSASFAMVLEFIAFRSEVDAIPEGDSVPWRPGAGHVCFHVPDFDVAVAIVVENGARILGEPISFPGGRSIYAQAPGGAFFELEYFPGAEG